MSENISSDGIEKMARFVYRDNRTPDKKIIFEFVANTIGEADAEYKKATGKDVEKQFYIGCEVLPVEEK
ncbi:MAG: hypothetical protein WCW14_01430 [Candidatus Paceibacterota bacterium]|jgi:hypothetical protein